MRLLEVRDLRKLFPAGRSSGSLLRRGSPSFLHALDGVSFTLAPGEALGVVGESGCGKSTLAGLVARLADATSGTILFEGVDIGAVPAARAGRAAWRSRIQMVFQDPYDSLDPRRTVRQAVAAPLVRLAGVRGPALEERVQWALDRVHLASDLAGRLPHQLSGGQLARAGIARAIALAPQILILDEATSALDVSIQAAILRLLDELRRDLGLSLLFVSHDLNVVRLLCQRVLVMYLGQVVEEGPAEAVFDRPMHPYTAGLAAAVPTFGIAKSHRPRMTGEPLSPIDPPQHTCRFEGRCFRSASLCRERMPELARLNAEQSAACHYPLTLGN
jgi:oligopeptide/dipeptide ABC transporter ATP-binding protein